MGRTIGSGRPGEQSGNSRKIRLMAALVAAVMMLGGVASAAPDPERYDKTPTGWAWHSSTTESNLNAYIDGNRMRLFDIEMINPKTSRFASAMVSNLGPFERPAWHWYYGLNFNQLTNLPEIKSGDERAIDVDNYVRNGKRRYAVVTVDNKGPHKKGWWWYINVSNSFIKGKLKGRRIIDIEPRSGSSKYDVVMIANKGQDKKGWWYYYRRTPAQIKSLLKKNKARLVDIEPDGNNKFTVVMVKRSGEHWWWYYGLKAGGVGARAAQNGARIIDIERYTTPSGKKRYAVIMLNNLNALSTKVRQIMKPGVQGANFGFYLKDVGGPVRAGLQTKKVFEPASTIKALHHLHAMRAVMNGQATLAETVTWYARPGATARYPGQNNYGDHKNKCAYDSDGKAQTTVPYGDALGEVILRQMMENSDNRTTDAVVNKFGMAALNSTATNVVGMEKSRVNHRIGCPHKASPQPYKRNELTLHDAGLLYEGVADGTFLNAPNRELFYDYMLNGTGGWKKIVDEEAAKLGKTQTIADQFLGAMTTAVKGGSYTNSATCPSGTSGVCQLLRRTGFGVLYLPFKVSPTAIQPKAYVYGSFVDGTFKCGASKKVDGKETACDDEVTKIGNVRTKAQQEMLRPRIKEALQTW